MFYFPSLPPPRNESCDVVNGIDGGERESARVFLGGLGTWGGNQVASNERTNWLSAMSVPSLSLLGMLFSLPDEGASVLILPPRRHGRRRGRERGEGEGPFGGLFALFIRILGRRGGRDRGRWSCRTRGEGHGSHGEGRERERMGMGTATPLSLNDACSAAGPPHNAFTTSYPVSHLQKHASIN